MPGAIENLPLFPLTVVLMPQMLMPLRIFEERYKQMLRECLQGSRAFGIVLIASGPEAGGSARPHSVGTVASIQQVRSLPQDEYFLFILGEQRFRIHQITQDVPFLKANIERFEDDEEPLESLADDIATLRELGQHYIKVMADARERPPEELPDDPATLSWFLAARLPFDPSQQQALLEMTSLRRRLRQMSHFLQQEMPRIEKDAQVVRQMRQVLKSNGQPFRIQDRGEGG